LRRFVMKIYSATGFHLIGDDFITWKFVSFMAAWL